MLTSHGRDSHHSLPQGHLSVLAAQSVYDTSMPRPSREMVRGEILPSAWILQPLTVEGKEITRVIYLAQVCTPCSRPHSPREFSVQLLNILECPGPVA